MRWSVQVELAPDESGVVSEDHLWDLAEALGVEPVHVTTGAGRGPAARFVVEAPDAVGAAALAHSTFRSALDDVFGVDLAPVARLLVGDDKPDAPAELVGVAEIAALLGVSRQRVHQVAARPDFPEPVARLGAGAVWTSASVDAFLASWPRRRTGRPPASSRGWPDAR